MTNEPPENPKECSVLHLPWLESEFEARALRTNIGVSPDITPRDQAQGQSTWGSERAHFLPALGRAHEQQGRRDARPPSVLGWLRGCTCRHLNSRCWPDGAVALLSLLLSHL